jgi:hypothetical protein
MARSLLKSRGMLATLWGEVVATTVYLQNRAPTKSLNDITPYEAWHGHRLDVQHLCTFGCVAFIKATTPHLRKLEDRGTKVVFIGYEKGAKAWRFYNPASGHAIVSRGTIFNEQASWNWENSSQDGGGISIEYHTLELGEPQGELVYAVGTPTPMPATLSLKAATPIHATTPPPASPPPQPEFVSPPPKAKDYLDANADGIDHRYYRIHDILGAATPPGQVTRQVAATLHLQIMDEPNTFIEAEQHQQWHSAMIEEIDSIVSNKTWQLVPLSPGHRLIGLKWVFKLKKNSTDEVIKHKARLVAKGYVQQQGWTSRKCSLLSRGLNRCVFCSHWLPGRDGLSTIRT